MKENKQATETEKATEVAGLNERLGMLHSYQARQGCMVCSKCGTAKHKGKFDGFKFWFAGVGYEAEPTCRTAT